MKTTRKITLKYYQRNPFKLNDLVLASLEITETSNRVKYRLTTTVRPDLCVQAAPGKLRIKDSAFGILL